MSLTGIHLAFGFWSQSGSYLDGPYLLSDLAFSQTMSSPGTSMPAPSDAGGRFPVMSISGGSGAIFYAIGPNPDANAGPRRYLDSQAHWRIDRRVEAGDKFAWTNAALTGVHLSWGYPRPGGTLHRTYEGFDYIVASETMASPGTSNSIAPPSIGIGIKPFLMIDAALPIFYAIGRNPDPTNGARRYYNPSTTPAYPDWNFANPGDRFAWTAA